MSKLFVNTIAPNSGDTVTLSGSLVTTGKLTIGDASTDTVAFSAEISSSLIPDVGATYDLGTMANSWRNLHAHGLGHIHTASINVVSSSLLPDTGATYALGTMAKSWGSLHVHGLAHIHTASINRVSSSLIPDGNNKYALGSTAKRWSELYATGISGSFISSSNDLHVANHSVLLGGLHVGGTSDAGTDNLIVDGTSTFTGAVTASSLNTTGLITSSKGVHVGPSLTITGSGAIAGVTTLTATAITASIVSTSAFNITKTTADSQDLNTLADYTVHGSKVEVKAITAAQIDDGAFASFKLLNTSIARDSIVLGSITGGTSGSISGSILTAATTKVSTASVQIHNETGGNIAADTPFTASFIVL